MGKHGVSFDRPPATFGRVRATFGRVRATFGRLRAHLVTFDRLQATQSYFWPAQRKLWLAQSYSKFDSACSVFLTEIG